MEDILYRQSKEDPFVDRKLRKLGKDSLDFAREWVGGHIPNKDMKYKEYIEEQEGKGERTKDSRKKTVKKKTSKKQKFNKNSSGKKSEGKKKTSKSEKSGNKKKKDFDVRDITKEIKKELVEKQRKPAEESIPKKLTVKKKKGKKEFVKTGVPGFDKLFQNGIPKGNLILFAGGAGSGKTIISLQTLYNHAKNGKKCLYLSFEESEEKLKQHMKDFGWNPDELIKKGNLKIKNMNPFEVKRNVDAMLAKQKGELVIDVEPVILPKDFKNPDFIVIDSLTAIGSAFTGKEDNYRIYIEQLFGFLEDSDATSFLITETEQIPKIFSRSGVEEFLADGVIVLYNIKHRNVRENAIEVLKLRGGGHKKKIVAMEITNKGVLVYPEQEVFADT